MQRRRLVRAFVTELDEIPNGWDLVRVSQHLPAPAMVKVPTEAEVNQVLAPWRPQWLRYAAAKIWFSAPECIVVWVRTHYDSDPDARREQDELFASWVSVIDEEDHFDSNPTDSLEEALKWLVLDDESLFAVGSQWERGWMYCQS